ncbi:MAG TPA: hypothetical protein VES01_10905 [Dermatophilaceae bacterium]|nr:hypothetical protein [Dermatophilaceae bacterium]
MATVHLEEEEDQCIPQVRAALSRAQLRDVGERMLAAGQTAPRRPEQPSAVKEAIDAALG